MRIKSAGWQFAVAFSLIQASYAVLGADSPGRTSRGIGFQKLERPLADRPFDPEIEPVKPAPTITLPPVEAAPETDKELDAKISIFVKSFRVEGNTVFTPDEIGAIVSPYVGHLVSADDLQQLRYALTMKFVNAGYITSGVLLPDQDVTDGTVTFRVVEGALKTIDVKGTEGLNPDYIRERVELGSGFPVNIVKLQEQLQILNQDPLIKSIRSQLRPDVKLGESTLDVDVEENSPYRVNFSFNNYRSPSIGSYQGEIYLSTLNLSGRRDTLELNYGLTDGLDDIAIGYYLPVSARDTLLGLYFEHSDATVVESPFDDLDIDSKVTEYSISLKHPFYRTVHRTFSVTAEFEYLKGKTKLLGEPFSFSPGVDNGKSEISVIRLTADWLDRQQNQVIAIRSTFNQGIHAFGSTDNENGLPDSRYFFWLGQFQWVRRFGANASQLLFRADVQKAKESLLPLEQFVVGGHDTVRGYRENLLVRDSGWITSLEYRYPVFRDYLVDTNIQLAAFSDFGKAWFEDFSTPDPKTISSAGIGVRFDTHRRLFGELYGALPFRNIDYNGSDIQDIGIHFNLTFRAL